MTGFWTVWRLWFRRSWVFWLVWVLLLTSLMPATLSQYGSLVPAGPEGVLLLDGMASDPTMRVILGPPFDLAVAGGFAFWRAGGFTAILAGLVSGLGIIRITRAEEEEGRIEPIRAGVVGRHVPLAAAVAFCLFWNLVLGALVTSTLAGMTPGLAGAAASGLAIALCGATFTAVGAVMAQMFASARTARYWTLGVVLGGLYLVRAVVDGANGAATDSVALDVLQWLNPLTWPALVRPYADERFWVLLLPAGLTLALLGLAFRLESVRDHGSGIRATRAGRAGARPYLSNAWGLAWRLHRSAVIGWTVGAVVVAVAIGPLASQATKLLEGDSPYTEVVRRMGGGAQGLVDAFTIAMLGILITVLALMAVAVLARLAAEEFAGHAEAMLATATSRASLAGSHLLVAGALAGLLGIVCGGLLHMTAAIGGPTWSALVDGMAAGAALFPGAALVIGFTMLLIGWAPRAFPLVWVLVGWSVFASWFGALLNLPDWLLKLQPWGHLPKLPADQFTWGAVLAESAVAVALVAIGLAGYRRRDIQGR